MSRFFAICTAALFALSFNAAPVTANEQCTGTKIEIVKSFGRKFDHEVLVHFAKERGLFKKYGLCVSFPVAGNPLKVVNAMKTAEVSNHRFSVDVIVPTKLSRGSEVVAVLSDNSPYVVLASVKVKKVPDLKGTNVASLRCGKKAGIAAKTLRELLKSHDIQVSCGKKRDDGVTIVPGRTASQTKALLQGKVAAMTAFRSTALSFTASGKFHVLASLGEVRQVPMAVLSVPRGYAERHGDVVKKIRIALIEARRVFEKDVPGAKKSLAGMFRRLSGNEAALSKLHASILASAPKGLCMSKKILADGLRFYASPRKIDLKDTLRTEATC